jgi:hypothetical protein
VTTELPAKLPGKDATKTDLGIAHSNSHGPRPLIPLEDDASRKRSRNPIFSTGPRETAAGGKAAIEAPVKKKRRTALAQGEELPLTWA